MEKLRFVGLDVHKNSVTIAMADAGDSVPTVVATVPSENLVMIKQLKKLGPVGTL